MASVVRIVNYARLKRKFRKMPDLVVAQVRKAMEEAANEVVAMMKRLVPVDDGHLRDSIGWIWGKAPKGAFAVAAAKGPNGLTLTIFAGNELAYYARWVEFGTAAHVIKSKGFTAMGKGRFGMKVDHPGGTAQPFFFPAWRASRKSAKAKVRKALRVAARQTAKLP